MNLPNDPHVLFYTYRKWQDKIFGHGANFEIKPVRTARLGSTFFYFFSHVFPKCSETGKNGQFFKSSLFLDFADRFFGFFSDLKKSGKGKKIFRQKTDISPFSTYAFFGRGFFFYKITRSEKVEKMSKNLLTF